MTRSVEELRRESERSRAELAATVDQLRERISDTAEDIRHKVSPQHIKSEISDYVSYKTESWVEAIKQRAMENPMQAIGSDVLEKLEQQTGLSQEELLARLSRELPTAVDKYTPDGRLPAA